MPHFIIDCSESITAITPPNKLMQSVYDAAESTSLFEKGDIKVRINSFKYYNNGNANHSFIHIFGNIMEGRSNSQKQLLSTSIIKELKIMFPNVSIISMNIRDFESATYCNKTMV